VTDRRTDEQIDGYLCCCNTSACVACCAIALVKKSLALANLSAVSYDPNAWYDGRHNAGDRRANVGHEIISDSNHCHELLTSDLNLKCYLVINGIFLIYGTQYSIIMMLYVRSPWRLVAGC